MRIPYFDYVMKHMTLDLHSSKLLFLVFMNMAHSFYLDFLTIHTFLLRTNMHILLACREYLLFNLEKVTEVIG